MTHRLNVHRSEDVEENLVGSDRDLEAAGFQILDTEQELEHDRELRAALALLAGAEDLEAPEIDAEQPELTIGM